MIAFELQQLLHRYRRRWAIASGIIFALSFFVKGTEHEHYAPLNIWDFVIAGLTQQFVCMVILPSIFLFLIADMAVHDINDGYIGFTMIRSRSRLTWLRAKVITLLAAAFLFTSLCIAIYTFTACITGMPFDAGWTAHSLFDTSTSPLSILLRIILLFVLTLTALGTFIAATSLFTLNAVIPWGLGALLSVLSYVAWMTYRDVFQWMPTAQLMFLSQFPNKLTEPIPGFSLYWSVRYDLVLFIAAFFLGAWRIRTMNISRSE